MRSLHHLFNSLSEYPAGYPVIRPDIRLSGRILIIRPDTGYKKSLDIRYNPKIFFYSFPAQSV